MGKFGGSKPAYAPPPVPPAAAPPPPAAPTIADASVQAKGQQTQMAARGANGKGFGEGTSGLASTIMTSPQGLTDPAVTSKKSLLGQ